MKRVVMILGVLLAAWAGAPDSASAQCDGQCVRVQVDWGSGYGCVTGGQDKCRATTSGCVNQPCYMAVHTDADGRVLSVSDPCGTKPSAVLAVKGAPKPARDRRTPMEEAPRLVTVEKPSPPRRGE